jgi:uncharacterized protein (TIGR03067 family)
MRTHFAMGVVGAVFLAWTGAALGQSGDDVSREHGMLRGWWNLEEMVDDGELLNATFIGEKIVKDRRVSIGNRLIKIVNPVTGSERTWSFRLEPKTSPRRLEIVNDHDEQVPGIYRFEGDKLIMCLSSGDKGSPPTEFSAPAGSGHVLLTMSLVPTEQIAAEEAKAAAAAEAARKAEAAKSDHHLVAAISRTEAASPREVERSRDVELARMLVGKWRMTDSQGTVTVELRDDGSMSASRIWDKALKRMFQGTTYSTGSWTVANGGVTARVTGSTSRRMLDDVFFGHIRSIDSRTVVLTDVLGRVQTATRAQ